MQEQDSRQKDDFYPTPPEAVEALLDVENFQETIWEPACGDGAISKVLKKHNYKTIDSDLNDFGFGIPRSDFLFNYNTPVPRCDIITNPPYRLANEFVLKAIDLGVQKFAYLLRLSFLEGQERRQTIFKNTPPSKVYVFSKRLTIWRGDQEKNGSGTTAYAWFVWEKSFYAKPIIGWV